MKHLALDPEWLAGRLDDEEEAATFAALRIVVGDQAITRIFDRRSGGERDRVRVPLAPLAVAIADNWWALLHEPRRTDSDEDSASFAARHRLDAHMAGYAFPALALWSSGEDTVSVQTPGPDRRTSPMTRIEFLDPPWRRPVALPRSDAEDALFLVVQATLDRLGNRNLPAASLRGQWARIRASLDDPEERGFCTAAGRLGLDPYDPDVPDLETLSDGLSEHVFADVCEAVTADELPDAAAWLRHVAPRLRHARTIDIGDFGPLPAQDLHRPAWQDGYEAAKLARQALGSSPSRRGAADPIAASPGSGGIEVPAGSLEGMVERRGGKARIAVAGRTPRQRRFRVCRGAYLAWRAADFEDGLITVASTRAQQASRAFAAEWLAPADLLRERAGGRGLTGDDVEGLARELECDPPVILHQARNHHVPLRGV